MSIRIITDSVADYEKAELIEKNIICIPMTVNFGEEQFTPGVDIGKEEFYEMMQSREEFPKTSQPSPALFVEEFEKAKESGDSVIAIHVATALSGTVQTANMAKEMVEYDNISVIDSKTATLGMKILVDEAVKMRDLGKSHEEIVEKIEKIKENIYIYAGLDTLENLRKGGRLSKSAASIGTLARIKPLICVNKEGSVELIGKQIGIKKAETTLAGMFEKISIDTDYDAYYLYALTRENTERFAEIMTEKGYLTKKCEFRCIGPTMATHIGVGAFGIAFVQK